MVETNSRNVIVVIFDVYNHGPVVLYELLVREGYSAKFVYYLKDSQANRDAFIAFLRNHRAMLVGFSFASHSVNIAFGLADYVSRAYPDIPVIFGGVHPTIAPLLCLSHCHAVCIGEGEKALLEVVDNIVNDREYFESRNLIYEKGGKVVHNAFNPLLSDLDVLPIRRPYTRDHVSIEKGRTVHVDKEKYFELIPAYRTRYIQTFSRGCPYACNYCCNSKFHEIYLGSWARLRSKSIAATIDEICENIRINPKLIKIFIIDDCFLAHDAVWLRDFVSRWRLEVNKELNFFTIPEHVTEEKLAILKTIDVRYCSIGLQSGSRKTNDFYNRKFSKEAFLGACNLLRQKNIGIVVNVILDNPWEEEDDIAQTLDILTGIKKPFCIMHYSLKIYPGTRLFDYCRENGLTITPFNLDFRNYCAFQPTDVNRIIILSQLLPRGFIFYLFRNRHRRVVKIAIRLIYVLSCAILPFYTLRVAGSRGLMQNIRLALSCRRLAQRRLKELLGWRT